MSSRSKTLIGGALAVIFVITMFNTNAIASLSNKVESALSQKVAYNGGVMKEYYVGNQQAATARVLGIDTTEVFYPDPEPGIPWEVFWGNLCAVMDDTVSTPGVTDSYPNGETYCNTATQGFANPGGGQSIINIDSVTGQLTISGTTTSAATAMKLYALGYVNQSADFSGVLKSFQGDNGISQTGTAGRLTTAALDAKVKNLRVWKTEKKYKIYSQDYSTGRQQAALGTVGANTSEPEPGGHWIWSYVHNVLEGTCTGSWFDTDTGTSGSYNGTSFNGHCIETFTNSDPVIWDIHPLTGVVTISGTSAVAVNALKLSLLNYMDDRSKMGPWPLTNISEEIKAFQRDNGVSQTGTVGKLTTAALDGKIANLRAELVGVKYWISSNDPTEDPNAEIFYRYPEHSIR